MRRKGARQAEGSPSSADGSPSLAAGVLAALPLFLCYELGLLALGHTAARAAAERVVTRGLAFLDERLQVVRVTLLLALAAFAWLRLRRAGAAGGTALGPGPARQAAEGVLAGFLLAPVLMGLQAWLGAPALLVGEEPLRTLPSALRLVGSAPWEELLFRVGLYGGFFLLAGRVLDFLGLETRAARLAAEFVALLGSALVFAWFHLEAAQRLLGARGEVFHGGLFLWRVSAGILLGGLFRWRGFGMAAWAHALYNLGLALGLRP